MPKQVIMTDRAPQPIGPYNQAVATDDFVFTAGQLGLDPATNELVSDDVAEQTTQALHNLREVLLKAGCVPENAVKTTVFLADMDEFEAMNEAYKGYFGREAPARSVVEVARLPLDARVEVECIAHK